MTQDTIPYKAYIRVVSGEAYPLSPDAQAKQDRIVADIETGRAVLVRLDKDGKEIPQNG